MRELFRMLERIRATHTTVLITGENGTGKELVARAVHEGSARAGARFVATNCGAFNDNLLESELFGHKRGAFTGAVADKPGLFDLAHGGTLFLDEVGDMSPALQVKLLRVLQEGTFMPVGSTETRKVDVRIVAATNRDLAGMVMRGAFRQDLYYRLHVVALRIPALRERIDDLPLLVDHFLARLGERDGRRKLLSAAAMEALAAHKWPGNVRELENELERLWVLSGDDPVIGDELLSASIPRVRRPSRTPPAPRPSTPPEPSQAPSTTALEAAARTAEEGAPRASVEVGEAGTPERASAPSAVLDPNEASARLLELLPSTLPEAIEHVERLMVATALKRARGNKTRAAQALGVSRRNLIRKVQSFGLGAVEDEFDDG
jgi:transcriptional regulator with PAS, ATPase and Fis domain